LNISDTKAISRHEIKCTLEDVIKASSKAVGARRAVCNGSQTRQACGYNMAYEKILHRAKVPPICTSISPQKSKPYSYKGGKTGEGAA